MKADLIRNTKGQHRWPFVFYEHHVHYFFFFFAAFLAFFLAGFFFAAFFAFFAFLAIAFFVLVKHLLLNTV